MGYASRVGNLLGAAVLGIHGKLAEATDGEVGRTGVTAAALATIAQYPGLTVEALRGCLGISQPATVRTVDSLQARGLLVRGSGVDRRSLALRLTGAGEEAADRVLSARSALLERLVGALAEDERRGLERALERVLDLLTEDARHGDEICRLCQVDACPQEVCPVECAARRTAAVES